MSQSNATRVGYYDACTEVTAACPVSATTYGYYPQPAPNYLYVSVFGVLFILCLVFGIRARVWSYTIALAIGLALETCGYAGRNIMTHNPWKKAGYEMQIIALILAPSFIAASVYLTLKGLVLHYGQQYSVIKARLYPIIFVGCDVGSIILQAIGGGIAAAAGDKDDFNLLHVGNGMIVAGIAFQVFTMCVFGVLAGIFYWRYRKAGDHYSGSSDPEKRNNPTIFCAGIAVAYTAILIRCVYRLPEMAGGWGNPLMRKENEFLILDGAMIALASLILSVIHPGFFFPSMNRRG